MGNRSCESIAGLLVVGRKASGGDALSRWRETTRSVTGRPDGDEGYCSWYRGNSAARHEIINYLPFQIYIYIEINMRISLTL
jgi:hypothetical protein